ncbi:hypothetical protein, partial [Planotetraspora phitsanulokensis]
THLDERFGNLWEAALIVRNPALPDMRDVESWWQVRPDLVTADPASVQVGNYYERSRLTGKPVGAAVELSCVDADDPQAPLAHTNTSGKPARFGDLLLHMDAFAVAAALARTLNGATIVANNPAFDRKHLDAFLRSHGQILTAHHRMIDVRALAIGYVIGRLRGRALADEFEPETAPYVNDWLDGTTDHLDWRALGVHQSIDDRHTALGDARLVRDVYDAVYGKRA